MKDAREIRKWANETAGEIRAEVVEEYGSLQIDRVEDALLERVDGCADVIYYSRAWDTVTAARSDSQLYDAAHESLTDTEGDRIGESESVDNVICRLAYWVLYHAVANAGIYDQDE